jgi:hypothetical protein
MEIMHHRLRTLLIVITLGCLLAAYVGWAFRMADLTHRAIHPEHFDENGIRKTDLRAY